MVLEKKLRTQAAEFLPQALKTAILSYQSLLNPEAIKKEDDPFRSYHDRGKIALAHIELLLKVAERVGMDDGLENNDDLHDLIFQAQKDVVAHYNAVSETRDVHDGE